MRSYILLTCYVIKVRVQKGCTNKQSYIKAAQVVLPGDGGGLLLKLDFMSLIFATRRVVIIHVIWTKKVVPIFCLIVRLIVRLFVRLIVR